MGSNSYLIGANSIHIPLIFGVTLPGNNTSIMLILPTASIVGHVVSDYVSCI